MQPASKRFAITGVAGYIAPRHLQAIKETGNNLVAALDPHDAVGVIDSYFPSADFFTETERFDRHLEKLKRNGEGIEFLSICSPNYLHDAHIRMALRLGANAICEKPLVLKPWNLSHLKEIEQELGKKVYTVLQLRHHPSIMALKESVSNITHRHHIDLTYITSRGKWYQYSWKGNEERSGGIIANIGIHFFDMLIWIFGNVQSYTLDYYSSTKAKGSLSLQNAEVSWFLSIDAADLPTNVAAQGKRTYRSLQMDGTELEFSEGFTGLHTQVYKSILAGNGYGIDDAQASIELVHNLKNIR